MRRILLVDDDPDVRQMTKLCIETMSPRSVTVLEAESGRRALDVLRTERVDLVASDLYMTDMTGLELLAAIKKLNLTTVVVIISGSHDAEGRQMAAKLGAAGFLSKPFTTKALLQIMGLTEPEAQPQLTEDAA
jgi:YesN/AraC family two-component response regulator